jgi:hypothetical protein
MLWSPLNALLETMHRRVCPLYSFDAGRRAQVIGSAVPFNSGGFHFLITATHVLLKPGSRQSIPVFTLCEEPRVLIGRRIAWEFKPGVTPDLDLSLIELTKEDVSALEQTYQFTTPEDTTTTRLKMSGINYIITGYPASRNRFLSSRHYPSALATHLTTDDIQTVSTLSLSNKTDDYHFALSLPFEEVQKTGGGYFRVPKAAGMSGGGIWRIDIDIPRRLVSSPLLVGIGIEHHKSKGIFVATRVQQAIPLLHDLIDFLNAGMWPKDISLSGR